MAVSQLDLSILPPIFILPLYFSNDGLHEAEDKLTRSRGRLTYQTTEARIFLGMLSQKKRAAFELRAKGLWTEEVELSSLHTVRDKSQHCIKRKRIGEDDDQSPSDTHNQTQFIVEAESVLLDRKRKRTEAYVPLYDLQKHVLVLKIDWLEESSKEGVILPLDQFLVYCGKIVDEADQDKPSASQANTDSITFISATPGAPGPRQHSGVIQATLPADKTTTPFQRRRLGGSSTSSKQRPRDLPTLHRTTTSEMEEVSSTSVPPPPNWLLAPHPQPLYSCLRSTPSKNPNIHFIAQLAKIKEARLLTLDEIGVRAYSTSIAALSAYPHRVTSPLEVTRLPGCDQKIAALWLEWHSSVREPTPSTSDTVQNEDADIETALDSQRTIPIVAQLESDHSLQVLRLFHQIWGVGPETAQRFHYTNGWTDLDDIVEYGWNTLTRVQQIGVKFYHEFQQPIHKYEAENIAKTIIRHARKCRNIPEAFWSTKKPTKPNSNHHTTGKIKASTVHADAAVDADIPSWSWEDPHGTYTDPRDFIAVIVGGYRRGNTSLGDVDVILSHRDDRMTHDLIVDLIASLETEGYVTHTLSLLTTTSDRAGETLPYNATSSGHGFDSLDKALCVWQDPQFDREAVQTQEPNTHDDDHDADGKNAGVPKRVVKEKNPNIHRRVDIIISPFKTLGCAVLGWSGGTTFQRDVRRWVKRERGWKFDSSGVRDRRNGLVIDLESLPGRHTSGRQDTLRNNNDDDDNNDDTHGNDGGGDGEGDGDHPKDGEKIEDAFRTSDGWEDRERRVMEGMGIGWRPANERCTG